MPRQKASRPAARPAAAAPQKTQTRPATTVAAPPAQAPAAPTPHPSATATTSSSSQPGLLAQMAATAGSVAVGSTLAHGLSSMLFGGSSAPVAEPAAAQPIQQQTQAMGCENQAKDFAKCVEGAPDVQACNWYLEQLKACQAAARPY